MNLTAITKKSSEPLYVGQVGEMPAVSFQEKRIKKVKANLPDAINQLLEINREEMQKGYSGSPVIGKRLTIS